ncbi:MAG TPA: LTA synthase family protein [Candidatus Magasanikbacteria bacterium]|nr:LTA synthase family protein [Candidatus Magasanikbacteria bacterium]
MLEKSKEIFRKIAPGLYSLAGPFIISFCWRWYHVLSVERLTKYFWSEVLSTTTIIFVLFFLFKLLFRYLVSKLKWHTFWLREFIGYLNELFFLGSLVFLVLFSNSELLSLFYVLSLCAIIFFRLDIVLGRHKEDLGWQKTNRAVFALAGFIFVVLAFFQYTAYFYFIFDNNAKYYNIVLFRVFSLTLFWLGSFGICSLFYFYLKKSKQLFLFFWLVFFWAALFLNMANTGVVYEAGLYLSPIIFSHIGLSGLKIYFLPVMCALIIYFLLIFFSYRVFRRVLKAHAETTPRHWLFYNFALLAVATFACFSVSSLRNTPEVLIIKNFYDTYRETREDRILPEKIAIKLEKFGLFYDQNKFAVLDAEKPEENKSLNWSLKGDKKPNLLIIYLESFSARLTGPYNEKYRDLTPGLNEFVTDKNTTVFRKVYNASTPTITALLSSLCSFLPPTGHEEIEREKQLKAHHLTCLPNILKANGYDKTFFVTAIAKEFANKDTILQSMGLDKIWGVQELRDELKEEPKSWGYSDHQLFPFLFKKMEAAKEEKNEPFVFIYETVDTHPPFDLPQDMVLYGDGENPILNTFHTTDDAFAEFWKKFKNSEFADNTVVLVTADHAIFPAAYEKKYFPDLYGKTSFYDELFFALYVPETVLPKEVDTYGSGIDLTPTILHLFDLKASKKLEGYSLLGKRKEFPNLIGMHEFGLYLNQLQDNERKESFSAPNDTVCPVDSKEQGLSLCELKTYYDWKRDMLLSGRLW